MANPSIYAAAERLWQHVVAKFNNYYTSEQVDTALETAKSYTDTVSIKDWNINDETNPAYIQNRPFYTTDPEMSTIDNVVIDNSDYAETTTSHMFSKDASYTVIYNGTTYTDLVPYDSTDEYNNACLCIGANHETLGTDYPFSIEVFPDSGFCWLYYYVSSSGNHTFEIKASQTIDIQLDEKYISYVAGRKVSNGAGEIFNNYIRNIASGIASHAEGDGTTASGYASHAEGISTNAEGQSSHVEGYGTKASGNYSHAEGYETEASGDWGSHAEGQETIASGTCSHAEGSETKASGNYSHAEGYNTIVSGNYSHAEGLNTEASSDWSHAEGEETEASGGNAHAEGYQSVASGSGSHAEGYGAIASGTVSHAEGRGTNATTDYAHAEGWMSTASGEGSHAEGINTTASGIASHAEGNATTAFGDYSHTEGRGTTANYHQHVQGHYNVLDGLEIGDDGTYNSTSTSEYAHIVGNGSNEGERSNAHTLDWSGNAWFAGDVYIGSTSGTNRDEGSKKLVTEEDAKKIVYNCIYLADTENNNIYKLEMKNGTLTSSLDTERILQD